MTEQAEDMMISVELPQYSFEVIDTPEGEPYIVCLVIRTSGTEYKTYLCQPNASDVETTARAFNREFLRLATSLKRRGKKLVTASGVNSDALRTEKRGQQRSTRGSRPTGPR